ncbi:class I SAM-dependent methyltransferase [Oceanicoccus sp. KOV_DT_Chl]|uniref:class I SAM-dependent methyltransferase n=1 Tax=Oceanicoccus sp. KOV_DT_Chl TaxID=1904639 RepID=UPI00190EE96D|nr:class I SAM-dependent methyltransferase [Oceanicoccus sp. KOV_DT_Chl]
MKQVLEAIQTGLSLTITDARRLFHGRGQYYEGLEFINVDWFSPVLLLTLYQQPDATLWADFIKQLELVKGQVDCALVQRRYIRGAPFECLWANQIQTSKVATQSKR